MSHLEPPELEKKLGIELYATKSLGIGGKIRQTPEDFIVEEVLTNGLIAQVSPTFLQKPSGSGRYLICLLVKRNWDTLLAVKRIAKQLHIKASRIGIAGIKDTRAVTAQHVSIQNITPEEVSKARFKDLTLHPICFSNEEISSRVLLGNRFCITIREIQHSKSVVERRIRHVEEDILLMGGLPNFYGHQRLSLIHI